MKKKMLIVALAALSVVIGAGGVRGASSLVTVTDLGTLGGSYSYASAVNDSGQVVGYSFTTGSFTTVDAFHAALWESPSK